MIEPLVAGLVVGLVSVALLGLRRLAWRYAVLTAAGTALVFATLWGWPAVAPGASVLLGAVGGAIAGISFERGERDRNLRVARIVGGHSSLG
jgi:hypothetical protein